MNLLHARARRRFSRYGVKNKLVKRLIDAKKKAGANSKPEPVKTHLRNMIVVPPMVASVVGVYNGQHFINVEIKPDMVGHYLGEFAITYKPVRHGGKGTGGGDVFVPLS